MITLPDIVVALEDVVGTLAKYQTASAPSAALIPGLTWSVDYIKGCIEENNRHRDRLIATVDRVLRSGNPDALAALDNFLDVAKSIPHVD